MDRELLESLAGTLLAAAAESAFGTLREFADTTSSAVAAANAGDIDGASAMLTQIEQELFGHDDKKVELARVCARHAELLLAASWPYTPRTEELRDAALRKAMRATLIAEDAHDRGLILAVLRVRTDVLRVMPGRGQEWNLAAEKLIHSLERAPTDTRRERAERWNDLADKAVPAIGDERRFYTRAEASRAETAYRTALALARSVDDNHRAAAIVVSLLGLFDGCRAFDEIEKLAAETVASFPRSSSAEFRAYVDRWGHGADRVVQRLRHIADALEARPNDAPALDASAVIDQRLEAGSRVRHDKFGEGTVIRPSAGDQGIVEVEFDSGGRRRLVQRVLARVR